MLWKHWWELVCELRSACARTRTFLWMAVCLAGMTTRKDLMGVTSIVRALGLVPACYDRLLDFFHSPALDLNKLTRRWCDLVFRVHPGILRVNGRPVLIGDGIKVAKAGRKMPGVKKLHQQSESNTRPEYIFGHSCQAVAVLTQALSTVFAVPLACRIHEGVVFSNRDQRTLLDKMILLIDALGIQEPLYFVADAYYASGKIVRGLLAQGNHLVTRVKRNSVAYYPATPPPRGQRRRGRPKKYGRKIAAYHRHIQLGLIAQGLLQILSATMSMSVWRSFGSWIRTIRPGLAPSEQVTAIAMRHALPEFIASAAKTSIFVKFLRDRLDLSRSEGINLAA